MFKKITNLMNEIKYKKLLDSSIDMHNRIHRKYMILCKKYENLNNQYIELVDKHR